MNSDSLDLDIDAQRQLLDSDASAGGLMGEPLLILAIHLLEVLHIGEKDLEPPQSAVAHKDSETHKHINDQGENQKKLTPTRTIFPISLPASSKMALRFLQHCAVFSAIVPSTSFPCSSAGICPATHTWPAALMAWLYGPAAAGFHKVSVSDRWCGFEHVLCHGTTRRLDRQIVVNRTYEDRRWW